MKELKENNFIIKNFIDGKVSSATKYMLDNPNLIKRFKKLSIEDQLDMAQMLNWNDRIIEVICTKSHNKKYSRI